MAPLLNIKTINNPQLRQNGEFFLENRTRFTGSIHMRLFLRQEVLLSVAVTMEILLERNCFLVTANFDSNQKST